MGINELPDPHYKLYPELDYDNQPYEETLEEKQEREFDIWLDSKDEIDMDRLR